MSFQFDTNKAIQVAAFMIRLGQTDRMNVMKLLKLLYIADRESLQEVGFPITGDEPWAMKHGPVLTRIYDLCKTNASEWPVEQDDNENLWCSFFKRVNYDLCLIGDPGDDELSPHDEKILRQVFSRYGALDKYQLRDLTHGFQEWIKNPPGASSIRIPLGDILDSVSRGDCVTAIEERRDEELCLARMWESL
ncbi:MAG: SocA family protein [Candidatus Hydrogenedentes bacterium]|nr:SocA family protein [Candidatus Hydrogenedentota bacterium]